MTRREALLTSAALGLSACASPLPMMDKSLATGQFIDVDGQRLHYRILGDGGPPAIALHGASGNLRDWAMGPALALARTNRVLLFDRPGLGLSTRPSDGADIFVQARLMQAAATHLGFDRAHVIGHSFGGSVAMAWALEFPDSVTGLMLLGAPTQVWQGSVGTLYQLTGNRVTGPLAARLAPRLISDDYVRNSVAGVFAPQDPPADYADKLGIDLTLSPRAVRNNGADVAGLKPQVRDMVPRYPGLPMPVELIHGSADASVPAKIHSDLTATQIPRATYQRLDGIGHMPHHVAQPEMLAALARLNAG